jgi:hypothetical protein
MIPGRRGPWPVSYALRNSPLRSHTTIANPEASSPNSSMILRHCANRRARNCRPSSRRRVFATAAKEDGFRADIEDCHIQLDPLAETLTLSRLRYCVISRNRPCLSGDSSLKWVELPRARHNDGKRSQKQPGRPEGRPFDCRWMARPTAKRAK